MAENMRKPSAYSRAVAAQIRAERAAAGLTREQVFKPADLSRSSYYRIEKGLLVVDATQMAAIAAVFNMPSSELQRRAETRLESEIRKGLNPAEDAAFTAALNGEASTPAEAPRQDRLTGS